MYEQMEERIRKALDKMEKEDTKITGGIIVPMSQCCGVPLRQTTSGVIMDYCPKCRKTHQERRY